MARIGCATRPDLDCGSTSPLSVSLVVMGFFAAAVPADVRLTAPAALMLFYSALLPSPTAMSGNVWPTTYQDLSSFALKSFRPVWWCLPGRPRCPPPSPERPAAGQATRASPTRFVVACCAPASKHAHAPRRTPLELFPTPDPSAGRAHSFKAPRLSVLLVDLLLLGDGVYFSLLLRIGFL